MQLLLTTKLRNPPQSAQWGMHAVLPAVQDAAQHLHHTRSALSLRLLVFVGKQHIRTTRCCPVRAVVHSFINETTITQALAASVACLARRCACGSVWLTWNVGVRRCSCTTHATLFLGFQSGVRAKNHNNVCHASIRARGPGGNALTLAPTSSLSRQWHTYFAFMKSSNHNRKWSCSLCSAGIVGSGSEWGLLRGCWRRTSSTARGALTPRASATCCGYMRTPQGLSKRYGCLNTLRAGTFIRSK